MYGSNEKSEDKIKKKICLHSMKMKKIFRKKFDKKSTKLKIINNLDKWKDIQCSQIRFNIPKMATVPQMIYRLNTITIKIPAAFFCRNSQTDPKIHMEMQRTRNRQNNLEKEK